MLGRGVAWGRILVAARRVDCPVGRFGRWRRPDRIIAVSEAVKRILIGDGIAADAITVVPDGIDVEEIQKAATPALDIRSQLRIPAGAPLAVHAAALVDHKDQRTLVRAARHAHELEPALHWIIAGEGPLRVSLSDEIARLDLRDRVHLVGYVNRVEALIAEASIFVMSSKTEGLGSVILNALALRRPVGATAPGRLPQILPADLLVPPGRADALARQVVEVLSHPAPLPFPPRCTARAMAQRVLDVYTALR